MKRLSTTGLSLLIAASGFAAMAQTPQFGLQLTLAKPMGDIGNSDRLDGQMGFGLGGHLLLDFKGGHALAPRVDYLTFSKDHGSVDYKVTMLNVGADYQYYLDGKVNKGGYLLAGAGLSSGKVEVGSYSKSSTTVYAAIGGGYVFTPNFSLEGRYIGLNDYKVEGETYSGPALTVSAVFRF